MELGFFKQLFVVVADVAFIVIFIYSFFFLYKSLIWVSYFQYVVNYVKRFTCLCVSMWFQAILVKPDREEVSETVATDAMAVRSRREKGKGQVQVRGRGGITRKGRGDLSIGESLEVELVDNFRAGTSITLQDVEVDFIDAQVEYVADEGTSSKRSLYVKRAVRALDIAFLIAERAVVVTVPAVVNNLDVVVRRVDGLVTGEKGKDGWELMEAFQPGKIFDLK